MHSFVRVCLRGFVTSWLCFFLVAHTAAAAPDPPRPNVVLVFADDLGYGDVGCYGAKGYDTPNIDRLAKEGVRFTDFYVAQAVCSASRAALLTGKYPNRVGILGALGPRVKNGIKPEELTLGEVFNSRGYATAVYGKWHLGDHDPYLPADNGFDDYLGLPYSNDMWPNHPTNKSFPPLPLIDGKRVVRTQPDQRMLTTWYTERAVSFVEKNKDRPFFLYVPHSMPHVPLYVSDKFAGKTKRGVFGDVIAEIDWSVGQILNALKRNGLDDNTLVIFSSDNGPWLSYGDHAGSAGHLCCASKIPTSSGPRAHPRRAFSRTCGGWGSTGTKARTWAGHRVHTGSRSGATSMPTRLAGCSLPAARTTASVRRPISKPTVQRRWPPDVRRNTAADAARSIPRRPLPASRRGRLPHCALP